MKHKHLKSVQEDEIGMSAPVGGCTSGSGSVSGGTVADLGTVPTPSQGLVKASWFTKRKKSKKTKGLKTLLSSLNRLT